MSTTNEFPLNPIDGTLVELDKGDNTSVVYRYDADDAAWKIVGKNGGTQQFITTSDVNTTMDPPTTPAGWTGFNVQEDLSYLTDQKLVNWFLSEQIIINKEDISRVLYYGETPPTTGEYEDKYLFWFHTDELVLYVCYEDAWFPVSSIGEGGVSTETFTYTIANIRNIIDEVYLKNIEQDNRLDVIEANIGELEEEIDAIAPSNERGEWTFNPLGVASPGNYAFLDGSTQPTERFDAAAIIYVSTRDSDNVTHSFNNHEVGEYLQIFNKNDDGYGLYQLTDIDDNSSSPNPFFAFTVDFVRSLVTVPKAVGRGRFKFFTIADGDPNAYVLKTGDTMTGGLEFKRKEGLPAEDWHYTYLHASEPNSSLEIGAQGNKRILSMSENYFGIRHPSVHYETTDGNDWFFGAFAAEKDSDSELIYYGKTSGEWNVANVKYVDSKYAELLAKIEELEMAGGAAENYRLQLLTKKPSSSGKPGNAMNANQIFSQSRLYSNNDSWYVISGNESTGLGGENGWVYVCFNGDEWAMNSTGSLIAIEKNPTNSVQTFNRDSKVFRLNISNAEKCPDEHSNGRNIWRFEVVPDLYKPKDYENQYLSDFNSGTNIYVTFAGGSLTKVTP